MLLFLLALAAVPGSLLPQRSLSQNNVSAYFTDHPTLAPVLDRLYLFDVFSSPWFAAIYLLLFVSLIGCVLPRGARARPRAARRAAPGPAHLLRLPDSGRAGTALAGGRGAGRGRGGAAGPPVPRGPPRGRSCRRRRATSRRPATCCSTCRCSRCCSGLAGGKLWGYEGSILVTEGQGFCNSFQQYDTYSAGSAGRQRRPDPAVHRPRRLPRRVRAEPDRLLVHRRHPLRPARRGGRGRRPSGSTTRCGSTATGST